jgi:hypothetical protein
VRDKEEEADNANRHGNYVDQEVSVVVDGNAVVDPWAVASTLAMDNLETWTYWSCFATHRLHFLQCLLRNGRRIMQVTQK